MKAPYSNPISNRLSPAMSVIVFFFVSIVGFIMVGPVIGSLLALPFYEGSIMDLPQKLADPTSDPSMRIVLYVMQGCATGIGLILIPVLYLKLFERVGFSNFIPSLKLSPVAVLVAVLIVPSFMFINSVFIEFNQGLELPAGLESLEQWMRATEDQAAKLTEYLTTFETPGVFILALVVVAVLPAIGEELVFRGVLQREMGAAFRNPHVGIWLSAILFSAIHMQFFGFIPRMLLGALFGYLYFWSGNLAFPIIAHFIQNGSQLAILYMVQLGVLHTDLEDPSAFPTSIIIIFTILTILLLFYFKKLFIEKPNGNYGEVDEGF